VMEVVQDLRARAYAQGNLTSNDRQQVIVEKSTVVIEPANPQVIYVPYYDPSSVYGPWYYPAYPPYYWGPSGGSFGIGISYWPGVYFGFSFGSWSYFDLPRHYVYVDVRHRPRYVRHDHWIRKSGRWQHLPLHRRGVAYRDNWTAKKFGQSPRRSRVYWRDTRGFSERWQQERMNREQRRIRHDQTPRLRSRSDQPPRTVAPGRKATPSPDQQRRQRFSAEEWQQRKERLNAEKAQRPRNRIKAERQQQRRVEQTKRRKIRENIFEQVDQGQRERRFGERGRSSRRGYEQRERGQNNQDGQRQDFRDRERNRH